MRTCTVPPILVLASALHAGAGEFQVTTPADAGVGSLRWAISQANLNPGTDTITFQLPGPVDTIVLESLLPTIADPVIIDGYTGAAPENSLPTGNNARLTVELTTLNPSLVPSGLLITAGGSIVRGLVMNGFETCITLAQKGGNIVSGNFLGVDRDGTGISPRPSGTGISVTTTNGVNLIGGPTPAARNLISGMTYGVTVSGGGPEFASSTAIEGNYIGTDRHGTRPLGNRVAGVSIQSRGHRVGGPDVTQRNLISGQSSGSAIKISGPFNAVQGNLIGTDSTGLIAITNRFGISVLSGTNQIGGPTSVPGFPPGNVISGNDERGIQASGSGHVIQGNLMGVDLTGTRRLKNRLGSLEVSGERMTIGGGIPGAGNVIAGSDSHGLLTPGAGGRSNVIMGNWIGTDPAGRLNLGNLLHGILISSARANLIASNTIAFNGGSGIALISAAATNTLISANAIHDNGAIPVDLSLGNVLDGSTPNDACDIDLAGANQLQNFPVISAVTSGPSTTTITGFMPGGPNATYRLEFFASEACDGSGPRGGQRYLGAAPITTGPDCERPFTIELPVGALGGKSITATATDAGNNTSEYSPCATAGGTPSSPVLTATAEPSGQVRITWTPSTPGWVLEETDRLPSTLWIPTPGGAATPVVVPAAGAARFYRLAPR